jgi:hypothetical protein
MSRVEDRRVKGIVKDGGVVLEERGSLPEGTPVLVTITSSAIGSPQAVLAVMAGAPRLGDEDVAALLHEIGQGEELGR